MSFSPLSYLNAQSPWVGAFMATALISFLPNIVLVLMPAPQKELDKNAKPKWSYTNLLLCFAVGALLGDVFLHALPHLLGAHEHGHGHEEHDHEAACTTGTCPAHDEHEHRHEHEHSTKLLGLDRSLAIELTVLAGFLVFFIAEKVAMYVLGEHNHGEPSACPFAAANPNAPMPANHAAVAAHPHPASPKPSMKAAGWLNLLADSMHNFTDGLAVGAAFSAGSGLAAATFVSVLLHELPHEISDYTILVQSGLSKWEAIRMQFFTAGAAFVGTAFGLLAMNNATLETLLLSITSGGFLYVAAVSVLPEVVHAKSTGKQLLAEVLFFILGVGLMVVMVLVE